MGFIKQQVSNLPAVYIFIFLHIRGQHGRISLDQPFLEDQKLKLEAAKLKCSHI